MANSPKRAFAGVDEEADKVGDLLNGGYIDIRSGAPPASPNDAVSGTLLAEIPINATAFGAPSHVGDDSQVSGNGLPWTDSSANATGAAGHFRAYKSDHTTTVLQGTVGTSGCDINLNSVDIQTGASVSITAFTYTADSA